MKKLVALLLFCCTLLACFGCTTTMGEVKPVTCEEVIQAYENAGYYVRHYEQEETSDYYCYMNITKTENQTDNDFIYFHFYKTEEQAKQAAKEKEYNLAIWIFALPFGETRWLHSKTYGTIQYDYYASDMEKPFKDLIASK